MLRDFNHTGRLLGLKYMAPMYTQSCVFRTYRNEVSICFGYDRAGAEKFRSPVSKSSLPIQHSGFLYN